MGIAFGDFDNDLDLDFYVTGFAREYNVYYEGNGGAYWIDRTTHQGLVAPTLTNVGFGTQAIDLDAERLPLFALPRPISECSACNHGSLLYTFSGPQYSPFTQKSHSPCP